ncbi:hypothetical protein QJQ45_026377 [Haematococcus lacustris]|nr:hypothetical protein QJQ45_026377 [Haematococcus lacustris]
MESVGKCCVLVLMAQKITVSIVDAHDSKKNGQRHTFKPGPSTTWQAIVKELAKYGEGFLKDEEDDTVLLAGSEAKAGDYKYYVTAVATTQTPAHVAAGRPGVGEATLTRNLASQTGEIQVVLHEAEVRSTAHFEEMKQEMKLGLKREMERQMKCLQAQLLEGEMNWWPEAFPCRAAFAAVGLATRDYFPGKHGVLGCFEDQHQTHSSPRVFQQQQQQQQQGAAVEQGNQLLKTVSKSASALQPQRKKRKPENATDGGSTDSMDGLHL